MSNSLLESFGNIDVYLFDQLLKGRFDKCRNIIDVGCGSGRNIHYFLKNNFRVFGIDSDVQAIEACRALAQRLAPTIPAENFILAAADDIPFPDKAFDLAICSAVLHFADSRDHFEKMLNSIWRVLQPGGFFFARLASDIGVEQLVTPLNNGRFSLPDGSVRYLVTRNDLVHYTHELNGVLFEPIKTTNVSDLRAMTTWCMQKK
jgi:tellurite methyltransferase